MDYKLPDIPHRRLSVTFQAEQPARLPAYQGSMLRGAFGHALRRLACSFGPDQNCADCPLCGACVYTRLFETFVGEDPPPFLRGIDRAVRPYVFEPGEGPRELAPGGLLRFDLLLFGQALEFQPYVLVALGRMARNGLGAGRARFRLAGAEAAPERPALPLPEGPLTLRFPTPLRLRVRHRFADQIRFRDLAFAMLRRTLEMAHTHVPGAAVDWHFQPLLEKASQVRLLESNLRWHDWERWSERQQSAMKLGGLMGRVTLEGDLAVFGPLLRMAEVIHVGKGATFGLGRVEADPA